MQKWVIGRKGWRSMLPAMGNRPLLNFNNGWDNLNNTNKGIIALAIFPKKCRPNVLSNHPRLLIVIKLIQKMIGPPVKQMYNSFKKKRESE